MMTEAVQNGFNGSDFLVAAADKHNQGPYLYMLANLYPTLQKEIVIVLTILLNKNDMTKFDQLYTAAKTFLTAQQHILLLFNHPTPRTFGALDTKQLDINTDLTAAGNDNVLPPDIRTYAELNGSHVLFWTWARLCDTVRLNSANAAHNNPIWSTRARQAYDVMYVLLMNFNNIRVSGTIKWNTRARCIQCKQAADVKYYGGASSVQKRQEVDQENIDFSNEKHTLLYLVINELVNSRALVPEYIGWYRWIIEVLVRFHGVHEPTDSLLDDHPTEFKRWIKEYIATLQEEKYAPGGDVYTQLSKAHADEFRPPPVAHPPPVDPRVRVGVAQADGPKFNDPGVYQ
jgi:hypothetical protein